MKTKPQPNRKFDTCAFWSLSAVCLAFALVSVVAPAMAAKPDCSVDPSHPSCSDDGGDGGGGADLEAYTLNSGFCGGAASEWFADTRDEVCPFCPPPPGCQNPNTGSSVPSNYRDIFTDFQHCMAPLTVPGAGSEILLVKSSVSSLREGKNDDNPGQIFAVQLYFVDDNGVQYDTDVIPAYGVPDAQGYNLEIYATTDIFTQGKGKNKVDVGDVCVDEIIYEPLQ